MKRILLIGAGRSTGSLIKYLVENAMDNDWEIIIADRNFDFLDKSYTTTDRVTTIVFDVTDDAKREEQIASSSLVISMLPAHMHISVAKDCIKHKKNMVTASYVSKEMRALEESAKAKGVIIVNEIGVDPGIDHLSAKKVIDEILEEGNTLTDFETFTGGLVAPESDNNLWNYKFTWNPRNVVLAGQGTAQYLKEGKYKYIPYQRLFTQYDVVDIQGMGPYEVYANRDSLLYREVYGLKNIPNILRGTIRHVGFCDAWNALVKIGLTDGSYPILNSENLTYHEFLEAYTSTQEGSSVKEKIANLIGEEPHSDVMKKLDWIGLFRKKKIKLKQATPALILEQLLLDKWALKKDDKDMIIMQHEFEYELNNKRKLVTSTLVLKGHDSIDTAMSRLVGLPLGIFVRLVMQGKITSKGVNIPVMSEVYEPVLEELKEYGVEFIEKEEDL